MDLIMLLNYSMTKVNNKVHGEEDNNKEKLKLSN